MTFEKVRYPGGIMVVSDRFKIGWRNAFLEQRQEVVNITEECLGTPHAREFERHAFGPEASREHCQLGLLRWGRRFGEARQA